MTHSVFTMFGTLADDRVEILKSMLDEIEGRGDRIRFLDEAAELAASGADGLGRASAGEADFDDYKTACAAAGLDWRLDTRDDRGKLFRRTVWSASEHAATTFHFATDGSRLFSATDVERALTEAGAHGLLKRLSNDVSRYDVVALELPKSAFESEPMQARVASFLRRAG